MTSNLNEMEQLRFFSTARRYANNERISAVEERWVRGYLDRNAPPQVAEPGFPQQAVGDARDRNNLRRTNWFNGRYLTAEALSRQDVYFDHRARLNAQALMPGIAWGLGIDGQGLNQLRDRERRGGFAKSAPLTLRRGLAFDGVGRPILVSQDFRFTLADLIGVSLKTPRRVVGGQREFMPCVCLAPDPGGPSGGSAALPNGPYLLVIEAGEVPEGKARVTGDVCGGRRSATCEADLWQGSFGLSLVRFPVDVPLLNDITDVWALRGTLSAYYFDVFEHPLWKRWDPAFPIDGSFARGSGPGRHEGMAIPLALVHLGEDNTALYLDSWIPRRLITATPGEDWHRTRFGAPPRAAVWARIHQFQTMLQESLAVRPMAGTAAVEANLHGRGFRHIPPIGFLPVVPRSASKIEQSKAGNAWQGQRAQRVREALLQAEAYFAATNVVPYGVVALHDDDILEDLHNVIDKDPLQLELRSVENDQDVLRNWPTANASSSERLAAVGLAGLLFASQGAVGVYLFLLFLGGLLRSQGMEIDALVNRRTEVVKLVVPLQGLSRQHPLLGALPEDAVRQAQQWGLTGPAGLSAASLAGLVRERDNDIAPRLIVVYVKQRLVLLDLVFQLLELLQKIVAFVLAASKPAGPGFVGAIAGPAANQGSNQGLNTSTAAVQPFANVRAMTAASASDYQVAYKALSENDRQLIAATLQQPVVQQLLLQTMATTAPAFAKADRSQAFLEQVAVREGEQPAGNPGERKALALGQVADAWAAEYPDAQVLQLLAAIQPAEQTLDLVKRLGTAPGPVAGPSVADGLELKPPNRFESNTERVLYAGVRERLEKRQINDLALDLPEGSLPDSALVASLTVGDVLARSPEEAAKLLGGADKLDAVTKAFLSDRQAALEAASGLADGVPTGLVAKVETEVAAGKKPDEVLDQLKKEEEAKPEPERDKALLRNLADASTLLRVSGNRVDALEALRRRPEG
jgi:hypothetical protein